MSYSYQLMAGTVPNRSSQVSPMANRANRPLSGSGLAAGLALLCKALVSVVRILKCGKRMEVEGARSSFLPPPRTIETFGEDGDPCECHCQCFPGRSLGPSTPLGSSTLSAKQVSGRYWEGRCSCLPTAQACLEGVPNPWEPAGMGASERS